MQQLLGCLQRQKATGSGIDELLPTFTLELNDTDESGWYLLIEAYGQISFSATLVYEWIFTGNLLWITPNTYMLVQRQGADVYFYMRLPDLKVKCNRVTLPRLLARIAALDVPDLVAPSRAALYQFLHSAAQL